MKRLILLIAIGLGTVAVMSAAASTASADHCRSYYPRYSSSFYFNSRPSYGYSRSYYGPSRYDNFRDPYYSRSYGYRPYGSSFGYGGSGISFRIGF